MPLDTDIATAADVLALERIQTQTDRNDVANRMAYRSGALAIAQARQAAEATALGKQQANFDSLVPELTFRQQLMVALASKFMTKSTSAVPATYTATSAAEAAKLAAAVDAIVNA